MYMFWHSWNVCSYFPCKYHAMCIPIHSYIFIFVMFIDFLAWCNNVAILCSNVTIVVHWYYYMPSKLNYLMYDDLVAFCWIPLVQQKLSQEDSSSCIPNQVEYKILSKDVNYIMGFFFLLMMNPRGRFGIWRTCVWFYGDGDEYEYRNGKFMGLRRGRHNLSEGIQQPS